MVKKNIEKKTESDNHTVINWYWVNEWLCWYLEYTYSLFLYCNHQISMTFIFWRKVAVFFSCTTVHHSFNFAQAYILMWWICLPRGLGHCDVFLLAVCPFVAISKLRRSMLITYFVVVWFLQLSTQCNGFFFGSLFIMHV